jgi:hypothetical protein
MSRSLLSEKVRVFLLLSMTGIRASIFAVVWNIEGLWIEGIIVETDRDKVLNVS